MANKVKTPEEKIQEAVDAKRIVMAESDNIDDYEPIAREFLKVIFDIDYDQCFISDESSLADFAGCGMPEEMYFGGSEMNEYYKLGRKYTVTKVLETYGIDVDEYEYLIEVFEKIRRNDKVTLN